MDPSVFDNCMILSGATGSGKSALALDLAEQLGAEILAMDSMTLYRGLDICTAKPSILERQRVPHHLIDMLDPHESGSVAFWLEQAAAVVKDIERRGKMPLFVGGTTLYLRAVLRGLCDGPPRDEALRERLQAQAEAQGVLALHERLRQVDPPTADRLHPNDVRRVVRALEVYELSGKPISQWQATQPHVARHAGASPSECPAKPPRALWICMERDVLYRRINQRVEAMMEAGLLDEIDQLRRREPPLSREASVALGYRELSAYLRGECGKDEAIAQIQQASRNFAKQQLTALRNLAECEPMTAEQVREVWKMG
jgi:tRNA dimethylallyltransferase